MRILLSICLILTCTFAFSQKQVRSELRKGNKEYNKEKYTEAEIAYRKALEQNAQSKEAAYNLGNSLYKQQKFDEAAKQYELSTTNINDRGTLATALHNYGNSFLAKAITADAQAGAGSQMQISDQGAAGQQKMQDLKQSIEAYKQALRNNPADDETRYNLALAQKLLEQEQQNSGGGQDNKQDKQEQQDKKDRQKQEKQQQDQQQQQQQQQQMQKDKAEQILEAMKQNERETQEKVKEKQMQQIQQKKTDKNW